MIIMGAPGTSDIHENLCCSLGVGQKYDLTFEDSVAL